MNWEEERYIRVYTRDTVSLRALGWEGRALFWEILRKADRAGIIALGKSGLRGLAAITDIPLEVVERVFPILLEDGCVEQSGTNLVVPKFIEAQEASMSVATRQKHSREKRRDMIRAGLDPAQRGTVIYFIQSEHGGHVKIGRADDVAKRIQGLATGRPDKLILLGAVPGTQADERRLHDALVTDRDRGEWFHPSTRVMLSAHTAALPGSAIGDVLRVATGHESSSDDSDPSRNDRCLPSDPSHSVTVTPIRSDPGLAVIGSSLRSDPAGMGEAPHAADPAVTNTGKLTPRVPATERPLPGPPGSDPSPDPAIPPPTPPPGAPVAGRAHVAVPSPARGGALPLPGMDAPPASRRGRRPKEGPSAEDRCREAYETGIRTSRPGERFVIAGKAFFSLLGRVVAEHARGPDESKFGGDALVVWFQERAEEFGRTVEPEYAGGYQPHAFAKWINARGESGPKLSADQEWVADRWRAARAKQSIPDAGVVDSKDIIRFWSLCEQAAHGALGEWKPTARQVAAFWVRSYLREKQDRANGVQDRGWPFGWLTADRCNAYGLPKQSDVETGPTVRKSSAPDNEPIPMPDFEKLRAGAAGVLALLRGR